MAVWFVIAGIKGCFFRKFKLLCLICSILSEHNESRRISKCSMLESEVVALFVRVWIC